MSRVDVASLRLRASAGQAQRVQARTEEALRLAAPDDERLVVLRRLDLGRLPGAASPAQWARRAESCMSALVSRAVHASSAAAGAAEAVWFASVAEARMLLLAELARGRRPAAWYWRLAVPDWRGESAAPYLASLVAQAGQSPQSLVELASAVVAIVDLPLLRMLSSWMGEAPMAARGLTIAAMALSAPDLAMPDEFAASARATARAEAVARLSRLPSRLRRLLAEAVADPALAAAVVRLLVRMALVSDAPELAGQVTHLEACVDAVVDVQREQVAAAAERDASSPRAASPGARPSAAEPDSPRDRRPAASREDASSPELDPAIAAADDAPSPPWFAEQGSAAAGLWLLVRPLARMGLAAWLEARPALAAAGFGPALLRHVAERMRVAADDPVFALLDPPVVDIDPALLAAWRIGLDRWLRRRTRRRLADVVRRRGWLRPHPSGLGVRFRLAQADIALRLQALDADPGWVPWLGRQVAYHYRDEALR